MPEGVNGSNFINNDNLLKYKDLNVVREEDSDTDISVFGFKNTEEESLTPELIQTNEENDEISEDRINDLESKLSEVKEEQGFIGNAWNAIKSFTGLGSSTNKCEQAIEDFKSGKISYEEADKIISEFSNKQKSSVNLISNIATGVTAVLAAGAAVATGGLSLVAAGAIGAGVGAVTKAGLKFTDRATNKKEGDALDAKQIAKDGISGAVEGAVSTVFMGAPASVTAETAVSQTLGQTVKEGVISGAKSGAIAGAATGASDYTIEAAFEEDVDFNAEELLKSTAANAAGGAILGGIGGGISSGISYKNTQKLVAARQKKFEKISDEDIVKMTDKSSELSEIYAKHINETKKQVKKVFKDVSDVENVSGRAKSNKSVFNKMASKFEKKPYDISSLDECAVKIADAYGTRVQMKSLTAEESRAIIEESLGKNSGLSYDDFVNYLKGDTAALNESAAAQLDTCAESILNKLKTRQTSQTFEALKTAIQKKDLVITELNNYGDELSSYFTKEQLYELGDICKAVNGEKLTIVTKLDDSYLTSPHAEIRYDDGHMVVESGNIIFKDKGVKDSGYSTTQMNTVHNYKDNTTGLGELQIRGKEVNEFADVEHIPYDIKQKKITQTDTKYSDIYDTVTSMSEDSLKEYEKYCTSVYNWMRLKELGIDSAEPMLTGTFLTTEGAKISEESMQMLSREGLLKLYGK